VVAALPRKRRGPRDGLSGGAGRRGGAPELQQVVSGHDQPPFRAARGSAPGQQADFVIDPPASRRYQLATFGTADTVLVLFEEVDGQLRYVRGDDDSGVDRNARISSKLFQGRRYVARVRLYWAGESGQTAIMYW
jgi:hypothetical protein